MGRWSFCALTIVVKLDVKTKVKRDAKLDVKIDVKCYEKLVRFLFSLSDCRPIAMIVNNRIECDYVRNKICLLGRTPPTKISDKC